MAENHPVGFQWVVEAREKGAKIIHVDPRFNRTSAMADVWAPLRAGSDIVLLGGLIHHVLENEKDFREYVVNYTNASIILRDDFQDTEELDGIFSGWDAEKKSYKTDSWGYKGSPLKKDVAEHGAGGGHAQDRGGEKIEANIYEQDLDPAKSSLRLSGSEETFFTVHARVSRASLRCSTGRVPQNR